MNFAYVVQPSSSAPAPSSQGGAEQGKDKEYRTPEEALEEYIFEKKVEYADQLLKSKRVQEFDALAKVAHTLFIPLLANQKQKYRFCGPTGPAIPATRLFAFTFAQFEACCA